MGSIPILSSRIFDAPMVEMVDMVVLETTAEICVPVQVWVGVPMRM